MLIFLKLEIGVSIWVRHAREYLPPTTYRKLEIPSLPWEQTSKLLWVVVSGKNPPRYFKMFCNTLIIGVFPPLALPLLGIQVQGADTTLRLSWGFRSHEGKTSSFPQKLLECRGLPVCYEFKELKTFSVVSLTFNG